MEPRQSRSFRAGSSASEAKSERLPSRTEWIRSTDAQSSPPDSWKLARDETSIPQAELHASKQSVTAQLTRLYANVSVIARPTPRLPPAIMAHLPLSDMFIVFRPIIRA
jgi:hypothetical protein